MSRKPLRTRRRDTLGPSVPEAHRDSPHPVRALRRYYQARCPAALVVVAQWAAYLPATLHGTHGPPWLSGYEVLVLWECWPKNADRALWLERQVFKDMFAPEPGPDCRLYCLTCGEFENLRRYSDPDDDWRYASMRRFSKQVQRAQARLEPLGLWPPGRGAS